MGGQKREVEGFLKRAPDVPMVFPHAIKIVGVDLEETSQNWGAYCPRADEELSKEWLKDIRTHGVREPVHGYKNGDEVVLLDGRRRVRAARVIYDEQVKADTPEHLRIAIPVVLHKGQPSELFKVNVGSESKKARTPTQQALLMQKAMNYGADVKDIAAAFEMTEQTVRNTLLLLQGSTDVLKALEDKTLSFRVAIKMVDLPREEQQKTVAEMIASGATKGQAAEAAIQTAKSNVAAEKEARKNGAAAPERQAITRPASGQKRVSSSTLVKLVPALKAKKAYGATVEVGPFLGWLAGGPLPRGLDPAIKEALVEIGWKARKASVKVDAGEEGGA